MSVSIAGYDLVEGIFESTVISVYRAIRRLDGREVAVKTINSEFPGNREIAKLRREFEIAQKLEDVEGVIDVYSLEAYGNGNLAIVMDLYGQSLESLLKGLRSQGLAIAEFLEIAIKTAKTVSAVHRHNVVHKDIVPRNILLRESADEIRLIDFGISSELSRERQDVNITRRLEGSLPYISPEQTGRMNRDLDYRSDYYSMGITFYEMLTGKLPFYGNNVLEWVHCHISKAPVPPSQYVDDIPDSISKIILKLISKNAEERYQSTYGLIADLEKCQQQLQLTGAIENFDIGEKDISENFQIPQKLYGRESEIEMMLSVFDRVADGDTEMVLVRGFSGMGKSALVNEINKPIVRAKGYYTQGKFDQFHKNTPYSALSHAFTNLVTQLLSESKDRLEQWRESILSAMGPNAQLMIDLVPELENIIGKQPVVQELPPTESQNRLQIVILNFVKLFAAATHPLVIFLDDLQWSDAPTLGLIQKLVTSKELTHLFLIGAYRDNEVDQGHPLMLILGEINKHREIGELQLGPLDQNSVAQIVTETLRWNLQESQPLVDMLYNKTEGNPFFVNELLKTLHETGSIEFNSETGKWELDLERAQTNKVSGGVVELMISNLRKLPDSAQQVMQLAACIGNTFDLKTLSIIYEHSLEETSAVLMTALKKNMVIPLDERYKFISGISMMENGQDNVDSSQSNSTYKFQHDRVQQAAYALIDPDKKQALHLSIGRLIQQHADAGQLDEWLIDIVRHLNEGRNSIDNETERLKLASLNLQAGIKAKQASAYQSALQYLETGISLLGSEPWKNQYDLIKLLAIEYTQCAYLTGKYEDAEKQITSVLDHVKTPLEKAKVLSIRTRQYATMGKMQESIQAAIEGLLLLGLNITETPDDADIDKERALVETNLEGRAIADLIQSPRLQNPENLIAIRLLMEIFPAAFLSGSGKLFPFLVLKSVNLSLRYGNSPESAFAYAAYGMLLCGVLDNPRLGYEYGKLALSMNESYQDIPLKSRVIYLYTMFIHHWSNHWSTMTPWFKRGIEAGYQSGDLLYLAYSAQDCIIWDPTIDLETASTEQKKYLAIVRNCEYRDSLDSGTLFLQMQQNFRGLTDHRFSLNDDNFDEKTCLEGMRQRKFMTGIANYHIYKAEIYYLYENYKMALEHVHEQDKMIQSSMSLPQLVRFYIIAFLTLAARYRKMSEDQKRATLKRLKRDRKRMARWAENCPENFAHLELMMAGELARISGNMKKAFRCYEKAIKSANENGFMRDEAMANELAARYFYKSGIEKAADSYLKNAHHLYYRWGASRKIEQLEEDYPQITRFPTQEKEKSMSGKAPTMSTSFTLEDHSTLDLISVMKASRAISSEIVLESLWRKIIQILLENAGAEKAYFVLKRDDQLFIEAKGISADNDYSVSQPIPVEVPGETPLLPVSIVNYVLRTQASVVLDNASESSQFFSDPYIAASQPQSIICLPIVRMGHFDGAIYMENNLMTGAFTEDRVEVMEMLAAQAAISIENAQIYDNLENKVQERTRKLSSTLEHLKKAQTQLVQSEKMAGLGSLVSGVAHEINNPANFVNIGAVSLKTDLKNFKDLLFEMIEDENDPEIVEHFEEQFNRLFLALENINEGTSRISTIVRDLRTFSRLDEAEKKTVPLVENLESTLRLVRAQYDKGIEFICEFNDNPEIECFPAQLNQVFMNLMVNACQSIHQKAVDGETGDTHSDILDRNQIIGSLIIRSTIEGNEVKVMFVDSGVGMNDEVKQKMFEPFYTTKDVGEGTGMGMSISYQIVEKHGGRFSVESEVGEGASISLFLPLDDIVEAKIQAVI